MQLELPASLRTGCFTVWTAYCPPADALEITLEHHNRVTSLWGRLKHDGKLIVFHVVDATQTHEIRPEWPALKFTWRARSLSNNLVLVADDQLTGDISFHDETNYPQKKKSIEVSVNGAAMNVESFLTGVHVHDHTSISETDLLQEIKAEWEIMNNDPHKADLQKVRSRHGCILLNCAKS